jgi:phosphatidylinositol alpha-mannosyltransferase
VLSAGKPIIATEVPGFQEVVTESREALLVPPNDADSLARAMQELLTDSGTAREMGRRAREKAERFLDWSVVVRDTLAMYNGLLEA